MEKEKKKLCGNNTQRSRARSLSPPPPPPPPPPRPTTASPRFVPCQGNLASTSTPPMPRPMALNQGQGTTFPGLGQPMDVDRRHAKTVCYNCQGKGHMARHCHNPRVPRQQV